MIQSCQVRAEDVTEACLEQIAACDGRVNAFITVLGDAARAQAREADREIAAGRYRGALHGVPLSVKDLIDLRGTPTTAASRVRAGHIAGDDAQVVARLRDAGAIFVGKCNLHEFAFGTTSDESAFGPVRHPADPSRSPGGSSGGSAAAVAAGMCIGSVGTDTGGSIRIPAAACGVVGLKPTYDELPCGGVVPLSPSLDHVGPLARTVADAWLLYEAMRGKPASVRSVAREGDTLQTRRLALPRDYFLDALDDEIRASFESAVDRLARAGVRVGDVQIPHAADIAAIYFVTSVFEAWSYHKPTVEARAEDYSPGVRKRLELGRSITVSDYERARPARAMLQQEVDAALEGYDALVLPTLAIPAPPLGATSVAMGSGRDSVRRAMLRLTQLFNLTGHPALSIPCGRSGGGLPVGFQLVGRRHRTSDLLRFALACEPVLGGTP